MGELGVALAQANHKIAEFTAAKDIVVDHADKFQQTDNVPLPVYGTQRGIVDKSIYYSTVSFNR